MNSSQDFDSLLRQIKNEYSRILAENAAFQACYHKAEVPTTASIGILNELCKERTMADIPDEANDNRLRTRMKSPVWTRSLPMPKWNKPLPAMLSNRSSASSKESAPPDVEDMPYAPNDTDDAEKDSQLHAAAGMHEHSDSALWTHNSQPSVCRRSYEECLGRKPTMQHSSNTKFDNIWEDIIDPPSRARISTVQFRANLQTLRGRQLTEKYLEPVMCLIIFINMILTGVSADTGGWSGWIWVDAFFTCIFILEITVKVGTFGLEQTFRGPQSKWNLFDTGIVVLCIVDLVYSFLHGAEVGPQKSDSFSFSVFRMFRIARMVRMFRVLRIPICKELWMMINGMVGGLRTLGWACVILAIPVYMLGFLLSQTLGVSRDVDSFHGVPKAMFTVIRCMTGECTDFKGRPLILGMVAKHGSLLGLVYVLFILITILGIFNIITAIFVENAVAAAKFNETLQAKRRQRSKEMLTAKIRQLILMFWEAQHGHADLSSTRNSINMQECSDMQVSAKLYEDVIANPNAKAILEDLEIAEDDYFDLFDILDMDGNGSLDVKEIIEGMLRLRGNARRTDVVGVGYALRALHISLDEFCETLSQKIEELNRASTGPHADEQIKPTCVSIEE